MISAEIVEEFKQRLIKTYHPLKIYIFGSYAWVTPTDDSDIDFAVIIDKYKTTPYLTHVEGHRALVGMSVPKDLIVFSEDMFEQKAKDPRSLCFLIKTKGKMIYAKS